ncbi:MAG: cytochrome bc1 complex diheme cytochrome c subunit [Acidimicrobiales bacterium]
MVRPLRPGHVRLLPVIAALAVGLTTWAATTAGHAAEEAAPVRLGSQMGGAGLDDPMAIAEGRALFETGCVSCHGVGGVGAANGPPVLDSGAASADFYLTTGRMPHAGDRDDQAIRKAPAYRPEQIHDLVAYVGSLGDGPAIPDVDLEGADLQEGGVLYRGNCAACHSATGAGGALSLGQYAPSLDEATPVQTYEAMLVGPGQMPIFGQGSFTEEEYNSIVRYVERLQDQGDPGGLALGRSGPIPEGFVAIVIGAGAVVLAAFLIGGRRHASTEADADAGSDEVTV